MLAKSKNWTMFYQLVSEFFFFKVFMKKKKTVLSVQYLLFKVNFEYKIRYFKEEKTCIRGQ